MREISGWIVTASSGSPVSVFDPEWVVLSAQSATLDYLKEGLAPNQDQSTFKISA